MKIIKNSLFSLFAIVFLSSCQKEYGVTLNFLANYDGEPLVVLQEYTYIDGQQITFGTSDFLINNVFLTNGDGENVQLLDLELIDFDSHNVDATSANLPISYTIPAIPKGSYTSITFSLGVDPTRNATKPESYGPDEILSYSGRYWQAWDSYIFSKFQGNLTPSDDRPPVGWLFHTGKDEVYRTFTFPIDLDLVANGVIELNLDHKALFSLADGEYLDIYSKPTNHDPQDLEPLILITENFATALEVTVK
jgi:hypothetical protein